MKQSYSVLTQFLIDKRRTPCWEIDPYHVELNVNPRGGQDILLSSMDALNFKTDESPLCLKLFLRKCGHKDVSGWWVSVKIHALKTDGFSQHLGRLSPFCHPIPKSLV